MKRLLLLLLGLGLLGALGWLGRNVWQTTRYFEENGREATLVVGPRYNAARWAMPPFKRIHAYAARLEPKHEVLIETDQELQEGDTLTIRFLPRNLAEDLRAYSVRPLVNTIRLRGSEDGTPVKIEDTDLFDRLVDRAMGPPAAGVYVQPRAVAERAPDHQKPTVAFVLAEAGDSIWTILRRNSRIGEWLALGIGVLTAFWLLGGAWENQRAALRPNPSRKGFVHPSLRHIEADAPEAASKKLTYVPKADEEILLPEAEKKRLAAAKAQAEATPATPPGTPPPLPRETPVEDPALKPLPFKRGLAKQATAETAPPIPPTAPSSPASAPAATPAPLPAAPSPAATPINEDELPSLASHETAPPMPLPRDVVLKLSRKKD